VQDENLSYGRRSDRIAACRKLRVYACFEPEARGFD